MECSGAGMTKVCYHCGRKGVRGYTPRMDGWKCDNEKACRARQDDTSPASLFRQIDALIDRQEYQQGNAAYLGRRIRKILDRRAIDRPTEKSGLPDGCPGADGCDAYTDEHGCICPQPMVCCPFCLSTDPNLVGMEVATGKVCRDAFHCPIPESHGNPFRYCQYCAWNEDNDGRMP